jgi:hypothetical protein
MSTGFDYEYCRDLDGTIGRRLILSHTPLAVAGERYSKIGVWFLSPEISADVFGERFEAIDRDSAADAVGEDALRRGGEATSLADVEEPPPPNARARWLIGRIAETQKHTRREGEAVGRALEGVEAESPEWWSGMGRWHQLCLAFGTLYSLWEELRLIQGHELQRNLERRLDAECPVAS